MFKVTITNLSQTKEVTIALGMLPEKDQPLGVADFYGKVVLSVVQAEGNVYRVVVKD
jgi:hypothetical protein